LTPLLHRCLLFLSLLCISCAAARAQYQRLLVLGGLRGDTAALADALEQCAPVDSSLIVLLPGNFLGKSASTDSAVLAALGAALRGTGARALLMPGATEWRGGFENTKRIKTVRKLLKTLDSTETVLQLWPSGKGCPGPAAIQLGDGAVLIGMDSEWWLQHPDTRPSWESDCDQKSPAQVLDELDGLLTQAAGKRVILAVPHTLRSTGPRGGYYGPRQHIFPLTDVRGLHNAWIPLPGIGSLYPAARGLFVGREDAPSPAYAAYASAVEALIVEHPAVVVVSGSEETVQLLTPDTARLDVVNGGTSRGGRSVRTRAAPYAARGAGFAVLWVNAKDGRGAVEFHKRGGKASAYAHSFPSPRTVMPTDRPQAATARSANSATAAVHPRYDSASALRRWALGINYRAEWAAPVRLPLFSPSAERMTFVEKGGGNTTTAVRLRDTASTTWALRTILKDAGKVMPAAARGTVAEAALRDVWSGAHPWAAGIAADLADAAALPRPRLRYVYLPPEAAQDTVLGLYAPLFAGRVAVLEERDYSRWGEDTKGSSAVLNRLLEGKSGAVDGRSLLRGRALDWLLADYDRHYDQWKWEEHADSAGTPRWYAIPKDRDQALFNADGAIMHLAGAAGNAYTAGLSPRVRSIGALSYVARDVDGTFLAELDADAWRAEIADVQRALTDSAIAAAVRSAPPEIYRIRGAETEARLRARRDDLLRAAMDYYSFLAQHVTVAGTNNTDSFNLAPGPGGTAVLRVWSDIDGDDSKTLKSRYGRTFRPGETRELRLFGLDGADKFSVQPGVPRGLRVRLVGGDGKDTFSVEGPARTWVYDRVSADNYIVARTRRTTDMRSRRRDVNRYEFGEDNYGSRSLPLITAGFNIEDGPFIGLGAAVVQRGFRVEPYKSRHTFTALVAPARGAWQLRYTGAVNDAWRHFDVVTDAALLQPAIQNFFGLGNDTRRNAALARRYYRVRYSYAAASALLRRRWLDGKLGAALGPTVFHYWQPRERAEGRVLETPQTVGLDPARVFTPLTYAGARLRLDLNTLDNALLPVRGARWHAEYAAMAGVGGPARGISRAEIRLDVFAPLSSNGRAVLTLRGGGGHIFSRGFEYFQALTLGADNGLRGYRKSRFAGSSALWGGAEVRWRLAKLRSRFIPGEAGVLGFAESGRVWLRGEDSRTWHRDWGGGVYYTPFNRVLVSAVVARSPEETLMNVSVGMGVGITF